MNPIILAAALMAAPAQAPSHSYTPLYLSVNVAHELSPKLGVGMMAMLTDKCTLSINVDWKTEYTLNDATSLSGGHHESYGIYRPTPTITSPKVDIPAHAEVAFGLTWRVR